MPSTVAPPLSKKKIEQFTIDIRSKFMISGCYFDIIRFMEFAMRVFDPTFDFECVDELPGNTYAYYDPSVNKIYVLNSVYENACDGVGRDRFTIAHELVIIFCTEMVFLLQEQKDKFRHIAILNGKQILLQVFF